jgi:hypothetical protein
MKVDFDGVRLEIAPLPPPWKAEGPDAICWLLLDDFRANNDPGRTLAWKRAACRLVVAVHMRRDPDETPYHVITEGLFPLDLAELCAALLASPVGPAMLPLGLYRERLEAAGRACKDWPIFFPPSEPRAGPEASGAAAAGPQPRRAP